MNLVLSLLSGVLVGSANVAGWAWALGRLGRRPGTAVLLLLILFFTLKLGLTALALYLVIRAPWFNVVGLLVGLGLPVFGLAAWRAARPAPSKG